jgi:hypothetical protein
MGIGAWDGDGEDSETKHMAATVTHRHAFSSRKLQDDKGWGVVGALDFLSLACVLRFKV